MHYPANTFPGQSAPLRDDTHFNAHGAYELARCVVEALRQSDFGLQKFLLDGPAFDPAHPDPFGSVAIPPSPAQPAARPEGS